MPNRKRRMTKGGQARKRRMTKGGQARKRRMARGGRARKRFETGGHTHGHSAHSHPLIVDRHGRLGPQLAAAQNETIPDNWADSSFGYVMHTGVSFPREDPPWGVAQIEPDPYYYAAPIDWNAHPFPEPGHPSGPGHHGHVYRRRGLPMKRGGRVRRNLGGRAGSNNVGHYNTQPVNKNGNNVGQY